MAASIPPKPPATTGRLDSSQIEAIAPSRMIPPRWPALMSAKTAGKEAASNQKTGLPRVGLGAPTRYSRTRPAAIAIESRTVHAWTPTPLGSNAIGSARAATGGGLTNESRPPAGGLGVGVGGAAARAA